MDASSGLEGECASGCDKVKIFWTIKGGVKEEKVSNWKEKARHGEFVQQASDVAGERSLGDFLGIVF